MCEAVPIMSEDVNRCTLAWNNVFSPINLENCLEYDFRDNGQSRVPKPPNNKTGVIIDSIFILALMLWLFRRFLFKVSSLNTVLIQLSINFF